MFTKKLYTKNKKHLDIARLFIEDQSNLSPEYFNIVEFPSTLTSGKNLIIILGKRNKLVPNTSIQIEILDVNGDPIYYEVPSIKGENNTRYIIPFIFDNTPIGIGKITLIGVAKYDLQNKLIRNQWANIPNIRWSKNLNINRSLRNNTRMLFENVPDVAIDKINSTFYSITQPDDVTISDGQISYEYNNNNPSIISRGFDFTSEMIGGELTVASPNIGGTIEPPLYTTTITDIPSNTVATVSSAYSTYKSFGLSDYTIEYTPSPTRTIESDIKSYLKLDMNNSKILSGDIFRSRLYFKDDNYNSNYELLDDFIYENDSLLIDNSNMNEPVEYGLFTSSSILEYWSSSYDRVHSGILTESINNDIFINSVLLAAENPDKDVNILYEQTESNAYINNINYLLSLNIYTNNYNNALELVILASGSAFLTDDPLGIKMYQEPIYQNNNQIECNIVPNSTGNGHIIFKLRGDNSWYLNNIKLYPKIDLIHSPQAHTKFIALPTEHASSSLNFKLEYFNYENVQAVSSSYVSLGDVVTYTAPTLDLTLDVVDESGTSFEIGTVIDVELTSSFTKNDAGVVTSRNIKSGSLDLSTTLTQDIVTYLNESVIVENSIHYSTTVNYAEGDIKNNLLGEPYPFGKIEAGSLVDNAYISGRYNLFAGISSSYQESNLNDNAWVRSSDNYSNKQFLNSTGTTTFDIKVINQAIFTWIIVPDTYSVTSIKLVQSSNAEILGSFDSTTVSISDGGAGPLDCIAYYEKLIIPNSQAVTYAVIVNKSN